MSMLKTIRKEYFASGWLLPAWLPFLQIVGRGAFNVVGIAALIWAAIGLYGKRSAIDRRFVTLYGLVLLAFLLGIPTASDRLVAWHNWLDFMLYSLFSLITIATIQHVDGALENWMKAMTWSGLVMIVWLYARLIIQVRRPGFSAEFMMREDNLPLVTPFLLYGLQHVLSLKHWRWLSALLLAAVFGYVIGSHGRAALVGLCVGVLAYSRLAAGIRLRYTLPAVVLIVFVGVGWHNVSHPLVGHQEGGLLMRKIDDLSTYRTAMWRHALETPPDNIWIGVGMGNVVNHPEVLTVTLADGTKIMVGKHLHNFVFDCWYATGLLGLSALLGWLGYLIWRGVSRWHRSAGLKRCQIGVLLAAAFAIVCNAALSYSYGSPQFGVYLFTFLALACYASDRDDYPRAVPKVTG